VVIVRLVVATLAWVSSFETTSIGTPARIIEVALEWRSM